LHRQKYMAAHQAWYATVNALIGRFKAFKVDESIVSWVTYVDPEIAHAGYSEQQAQAEGVVYEKTTYSLAELDRAITDDEALGFIKVLSDPVRGRIIGVTIVGQSAGEILAEFVLAMKQGIGLNTLLSIIHCYPTMSEASKHLAGKWKKQRLAPWKLNLAEKYFKWRRG